MILAVVLCMHTQTLAVATDGALGGIPLHPIYFFSSLFSMRSYTNSFLFCNFDILVHTLHTLHRIQVLGRPPKGCKSKRHRGSVSLLS